MIVFEIPFHKKPQITRNADNLSLAIVDFDQGGKSSVTFSPDTGAVIKETKIQESPRRVAGSYIQPMKRDLRQFKGKIGMYICKGHLAFFRQYEKPAAKKKKNQNGSEDDENQNGDDDENQNGDEEENMEENLDEAYGDMEEVMDNHEEEATEIEENDAAMAGVCEDGKTKRHSINSINSKEKKSSTSASTSKTGPWECTGFITNFSWAGESNRLTPCIAFRDQGKYHAEITSFGTKPPPFMPEMKAEHLDKEWTGLNWEA